MPSPSPRTLPQVVETSDALRTALAAARQAGKTIGLVPTMGALHAGHLSLVEASRRQCDFTVVTIFVNPTQFGPHEDYQRYPRMLDEDLQLLARGGADLVFAPNTETMYPEGFATYVEVQGVAQRLEGSSRPHHFRGVATIVLKLFLLTGPDKAFFGQKDYQQTRVIRRLARDMELPIEICVCPIVREADGLAMSSRNMYLSPAERQQALVLHRSLQLAAQLLAEGEHRPATILERMQAMFAAETGVQLEYAVLADPETLVEVDSIRGPLVALVAARVGSTRLIDNELLFPPAG